MDWWILELIVTLLLVAILTLLGALEIRLQRPPDVRLALIVVGLSSAAIGWAMGAPM